MKISITHQVVEIIQQAWSISQPESLDTTEALRSVSFCDIDFGDFASNIALVQGKKTGHSPRELGEALVQACQQDERVASAEVAGPGFINLRLSDQVWNTYLAHLDDKYYVSDDGAGKSVNVEFISANPTGPLVLVNAWGGYYGDILARIYESQGYTVAREYYLNDGGNQIAQLGRAVQQAAGKEFSEEVAAELYRGDYVDRLAETIAAELGGDDALLVADPEVVGDKAKVLILDTLIKPTLERLGIKHDEMYSETRLDNAATIALLRTAGVVKEYDGATWLDGEKAGLDHDEVLVRSTDGGDTYFLKDISYQLTKLVDRHFDTAITIVGPDHHGQEKRLMSALAILKAPGFVPLWTQTVRLIKDGAEYKMSKRRGNYIVLDDFLDMVPADSARFFFAMRDTNTHLDLDLDILVRQDKHNPLYYVLYSYVRCKSVLAKAGVGDTQLETSSSELDAGQRRMLRDFVQLQAAIESTTQTYQIHPIMHRLIELARSFHDWYERTPLATESDQTLRQQRLAFVQHYLAGLKGLLDLIGLTPIERM